MDILHDYLCPCPPCWSSAELCLSQSAKVIPANQREEITGGLMNKNHINATSLTVKQMCYQVMIHDRKHLTTLISSVPAYKKCAYSGQQASHIRV